MLVIGSIGSGKTRRIVLPSIFALGELGESMVIPDPKGELYLSTCEHLEAKGYRVDTIDLRDPSRSVQWSPLDLIVDLIWSSEIAHAEDMAHELAKTIVSAQLGGHGGNEAFWNASAEAIIAATALLIASEPKGVDPLSRNMFNVYRALGTYGRERTAVRAGSLRQEQIYPLKEIIEGLDDRHPEEVGICVAALIDNYSRSHANSRRATNRATTQPYVDSAQKVLLPGHVKAPPPRLSCGFVPHQISARRRL